MAMGPLRGVSHVFQNRGAGAHEMHWDKTNKGILVAALSLQLLPRDWPPEKDLCNLARSDNVNSRIFGTGFILSLKRWLLISNRTVKYLARYILDRLVGVIRLWAQIHNFRS